MLHISVSIQLCSCVNWLCVHDTAAQLMPVCLYAQSMNFLMLSLCRWLS